MDVYVAMHNYTKERDDVLSFSKGDRFCITKKTNDNWWRARKMDDDTCGYVPSVYLKQSTERVIGRLIPEGRRDTEEHKIHMKALAEIHQKVKPFPAHVIGQAIGVELHSSDEEEEPKRSPVPIPNKQSVKPRRGSRNKDERKKEEEEEEEDDLPDFLKTMPPPPMASPPPPDYDMEDDAKDRNDMPFHHKLNSSGRYSSVSSEESTDLSPTSTAVDESMLIKPKPLSNPVKESKDHKQLHRELRLSYRTGGPLNKKPELTMVNRERRLEEKKREQENEKKSRRTSMEIKMQERQDKERMEEEKEQLKQKEAIKEERKPEFMKVRLKQTNSLPRS